MPLKAGLAVGTSSGGSTATEARKDKEHMWLVEP